MRTVAAAIDALLQGRLPEAGDLRIQRLKALEQSVRDKDLGGGPISRIWTISLAS